MLRRFCVAVLLCACQTAGPSTSQDLSGGGDPVLDLGGGDLASSVGDLAGGASDLLGGELGGGGDLADPGARCREPADCPSQVCRGAGTGAGRCARTEDVLYVDNQGGQCSGGHAGTQADPFCALADALGASLPMGAERLVRVAASSARYDGAVLTQSVAIYGPGLQVMAAQRATVRATMATGFRVFDVQDSGGAAPVEVTIDGVDLTGSLNSSVDGLLRCSGDGRTRVALIRSQVYSSAGPGVVTNKCAAALSRVLVNSTGGGGLLVTDGSATVENSFFINSPRGPALRSEGGAALSVRFSTLVGNGAAGAAGAAQCNAQKACSLSGVLLVQNKRPAGGSQLAGTVQISDSALDEAMAMGTGLRLNAAPEFAGPSNYRLAPGPGSRACCIDQVAGGAATQGLVWDYDGNGRPAGAAFDIGGFEVQ